MHTCAAFVTWTHVSAFHVEEIQTIIPLVMIDGHACSLDDRLSIATLGTLRRLNVRGGASRILCRRHGKYHRLRRLNVQRWKTLASQE